MGRAVALRDDFNGSDLRRLARLSKDAARIGDVGLQVVRDWVLRFNAKGHGSMLGWLEQACQYGSPRMAKSVYWFLPG